MKTHDAELRINSTNSSTRMTNKPRELPTTNLKPRALSLLSHTDKYINAYRHKYDRDPPCISLNPQQWKLLEAGVEATDLELGDCTYRGIHLRLVEESPGAGTPGSL
jgi:hypothetical protein